MFCEKCGGELRQEENKLVCTKCGAEFPPESAANSAQESDFVQPAAAEIVPRGFSNKKLIIALVSAVAVMVAAAVVFIVLNPFKPQNQPAATGGVEVAERFLWEQNYEQAVIEFEKVLEIEPMNVDAYLGLADAYIGLGDTEKALEALRKGFELTGDPRLQAKIDELTNANEPESGSMGFVTIAGWEYDVATTTNLYLKEKGLTDEDMKALAGLTRLEDLDLGGNEISDLTPLAGLTKLERLDFYNNEISDITPLAGLTKLERLWLRESQISDLTPLAGLTKLERLWLRESQISDLTPLAGLTNLTELYLWENQISDITPLAGLTKLEGVRLDSDQISYADWEWLKAQLPCCNILF